MKKYVFAFLITATFFLSLPALAAEESLTASPAQNHFLTDRLTIGLDLGFLPGLKVGYKHTFGNGLTLGADLDLDSLGVMTQITACLTLGYRVPLGKPPYSFIPYLIAGGGMFNTFIAEMLSFNTVPGTWGTVVAGIGFDFAVHRILSIALEGGPAFWINSGTDTPYFGYARIVLQFNVWQE